MGVSPVGSPVSAGVSLLGSELGIDAGLGPLEGAVVDGVVAGSLLLGVVSVPLGPEVLPADELPVVVAGRGVPFEGSFDDGADVDVAVVVAVEVPPGLTADVETPVGLDVLLVSPVDAAVELSAPGFGVSSAPQPPITAPNRVNPA